ncbi:MAG: ABC transporter ATP-binding protein [Dehalococcoidales bacterium]|nr:ABC transporter ATP-binding protein [Dehalococcoidales bacterium]
MLEAVNISKSFKKMDKKGTQKVLDNVTFNIRENETVSIMGKSGEGKSTIARILCGTIKPDSGRIQYNGEALFDNQGNYDRRLHTRIQLIPQQPFSALDPKQRVGDAIAEPLLYHRLAKDKTDAACQVKKLLEQVWLEDEIARRFPSQISGGQAQRITIARALALKPGLLIADESTSMLDVSAQAQIINIFKDLLKCKQLSILLISHDKALVEVFSNRVYHLSQGSLQEIN